VTKWIVGIILATVLVVVGLGILVDAVFEHDMRNAEEHCASLGAEPHYTYQTRYICITPDGRVVS
jgi:hypothetical protein